MSLLKILKPELGGEKWVDDQLTFGTKSIAELPDRCYAFLDVEDYAPVDGRREAILAHLGVPKFVANRTCFESNGFFGHRATYGEINGQRRLTGCTSWLRYLVKMVKKIEKGPHEDWPEYARRGAYQWYEMSVFSRWEYPDKCQVLCIDTPYDLPMRLREALVDHDKPLDFRDPFAMHVDLWDLMIVYSDISVWRVRDSVRQLEKSRRSPGEMFLPTHEYSRHAIHVSEVLEAAVETLTAADRCRSELHEHVPELNALYKSQAEEYSRFQISLLKSFKLRSDSSRARIATEITFAFNSLSRQDNHLIKSISLLTMIFLPAMLVCDIFGTSFFDLGDKGWEVSGKIWILWVTIVSATIIVVFVWQVWFAKHEETLEFLRSLGALVKQSVRSPWKRDAVLAKARVGEP